MIIYSLYTRLNKWAKKSQCASGSGIIISFPALWKVHDNFSIAASATKWIRCWKISWEMSSIAIITVIMHKHLISNRYQWLSNVNNRFFNVQFFSLPVVLYWLCCLLSVVLKCEINALKKEGKWTGINKTRTGSSALHVQVGVRTFNRD